MINIDVYVYVYTFTSMEVEFMIGPMVSYWQFQSDIIYKVDIIINVKLNITHCSTCNLQSNDI